MHTDFDCMEGLHGALWRVVRLSGDDDVCTMTLLMLLIGCTLWSWPSGLEMIGSACQAHGVWLREGMHHGNVYIGEVSYCCMWELRGECGVSARPIMNYIW